MNTTQNGAFLTRIRMLSGAQLKYIAFASMLIDHINKALIYPKLDGGWLLSLSDAFDILGRIAFPLFAFLLVEGFFHTHSRKKYLGTLLLFGVISEIPFDLFSTGVLVNWRWQNVMFSLAMMLVTIWMIDYLREKLADRPHVIWYLLSFVIVAVMCYAAMFTGVDYEHHAILIGYVFYLMHKHPFWSIALGYCSIWKEPWSLLGFGLTLAYNGERGKQYKLLNYCFYPGHLLILGLLRLYWGI